MTPEGSAVPAGTVEAPAPPAGAAVPGARSVRVALVIGQLGLGGGAERQLAMLATRLPAHGFSPFAVSLRAGRDATCDDHWAVFLRERGVRVYEIERARKHDILRLFPLVRILRDERPAIVHSFLLSANAYARAAALLAGGRPILIPSERNAVVPESWLERGVDAFLRRFTDGIIANAEAVRRLLIERGVRVPIWVVRNGLEAGPAAEEGRRKARRSLGLPGDGPLIGTVGRMVPQKNYALFLEVCRRVRQVIPTCRAVAFGDGPQRPSIEAAVRGPGLDGTVLLAGRVPNLAELLPALDVFVLTSDHEGLPNALLEAQAAGIPCVATAVGGNGETVVDGRTGYVVPAGDAASLADRIVGLLEDPARRSAMGAAARQRALGEFSAERMVAGTAAVYEALLRRRGGAGVDRASGR